jgi:hypothetical protein
LPAKGAKKNLEMLKFTVDPADTSDIICYQMGTKHTMIRVRVETRHVLRSLAKKTGLSQTELVARAVQAIAASVK